MTHRLSGYSAYLKQLTLLSISGEKSGGYVASTNLHPLSTAWLKSAARSFDSEISGVSF
jgi:hypothetical protein